MVAPSPTKARTFSYCGGRMTLKIREPRKGSIDDREPFWNVRKIQNILKARQMPGQAIESIAGHRASGVRIVPGTADSSQLCAFRAVIVARDHAGHAQTGRSSAPICGDSPQRASASTHREYGSVFAAEQ
jgi:hypothetical protein